MTITAQQIRTILASAEAGWTVPEIEADINGYDEIVGSFEIDFAPEQEPEVPEESLALLPAPIICNFYNMRGEPEFDLDEEQRSASSILI